MTDQELFYRVLAFIPMSLMLAGFVKGLVSKSALGKVQKLLVVSVLLALLAEILAIIFLENGVNTYPLFHIYAPLAYSTLTLAFMQMTPNGVLKRLLRISIPLILLYAIVNILSWQKLSEPNTNVTVVMSTILSGLSVYFFFDILTHMRYKHIEKSGFFWMLVGILIYYSSSLLLFVFSDWLKLLEFEQAINVWYLNILINVLYYICINIALWKKPE